MGLALLSRNPDPLKHSGRRRDVFSVATVAVATMALLFIGSAIFAIVIGGIAHFEEAVTSEEVLFSLRMSVVTSTVSTVLCLLLALPTAYALSHVRMPFKRVAEVLMELTLSLPYILLGFALLLIFSSPFGKALRDCGFAVVFEPTGIVFAQLIVNLPFAIRMIRTAFSDVSPRMEFVAKTLGAMPGDVFRTVILPQCRNSIISTFVLTWARGMGEFGATLMLVGVTRMKTETLPGSIYLSISTGNNDIAMATAMIMLLLSAATLVVANVLNRPVAATRMGGRASAARGCGPAGRGCAAIAGTAERIGCVLEPVRRALEPVRRLAGRCAAWLHPRISTGAQAGSVSVQALEVSRGSFCLRVDDLEIRPREVFAILGSTGSGKTVLMESIAGAFEFAGGSILLEGKDVAELPVQQRHLGIVYQDYALFPHMTVFDNVAYGLRMHGFAADEIQERVNEMLAMFGIGHIADRYPGVISGGESQRVALARALVLRPGIMLLDEPFSALDPATKRRMYETFRRVHERFDCTIVLVTHDFNEAQTLADRVGIVLDGRLRAVRCADELFGEPIEPDVRYFLGIDQAGCPAVE